MAVLIRNARVLTLDDGDTEHDCADILIEGATIAAVGANLAAPAGARIIDATGLLAMPGLVNAHYHSSSVLFKGAFEGTPLEIIMLYEDPPLDRFPERDRLVRLRTLLGAAEMLKLGITALRDDCYFVPGPSRAEVDAIMQAYADSGIRANLMLDVGNAPELDKYPFLRDLLPAELRRRIEAEPVASAGELLSLYRDTIERWHGGADGRLSIGVSCSAPQRVTPDYLQALGDLSRQHDLAYDTHVLESRVQRVLGEVRYGKSLIRYLHDHGVLTERMVVVHAVWVDEADMRLMAESGCSVAHNPVSNLKLGSGIMPYRRLRDHGIPICLGSDEACADDTSNMWGVAKTAALVQKINEPDYRRWPAAREFVTALTRGGARAMRRAGQGGMLAPGRDADLILLDLNSTAFTPLNDLRRQLVYAENGSSVVLTMVAGNVVTERGRLLTIDEDALRAELRDLMPAYRGLLDDLARSGAEREPYYREMYLKSAVRNVGINRWAGPIEP